MLKIATGGLRPHLIASRQILPITKNVCQRLAPIFTSSAQKFLLPSPVTYKTYSVKDHDDFDRKVINSDHPVVVDFHAEWCDPCKVLTPKLSELLDKSKNIDLAIVDVEENADLVETFHVKAVPAVLAFRNGVVVDKFVGLVDANSLEMLISKLDRKNRHNPGATEIK